MIDWHIWVREEVHSRLAFRGTNSHEGRRIVELQTSQALLNSPQEAQPTIDQYGRKPFQHPALNGLQGLSDEAESKVLDKARLSQIAERYDLDKVTRWKPKRVRTTRRRVIGEMLIGPRRTI
jgi:large subunit ribosomal protein L15